MGYLIHRLNRIKILRVSSYSPELSNPLANPHNLVPTSPITMSTAIVLPTLTQWAQGHITAINKATNDKDLSRPLDDFLSKNATIVVNISRAEYEKQLQGEKFQEIGATVSFLGAVQVLADKDKPFDVSSLTTMTYLYRNPVGYAVPRITSLSRSYSVSRSRLVLPSYSTTKIVSVGRIRGALL